MRLLVVDDDKDDLELYEEIIPEIDRNVSIIKAHTGLDALSLLAKDGLAPDLIILDYNLPVMNGLEMLQAMRADSKFKNVHVAVLTTACPGDDTKAFNKLGAECYTKPSNWRVLRRILERIIHKARNTR